MQSGGKEMAHFKQARRRGENSVWELFLFFFLHWCPALFCNPNKVCFPLYRHTLCHWLHLTDPTAEVLDDSHHRNNREASLNVVMSVNRYIGTQLEKEPCPFCGRPKWTPSKPSDNPGVWNNFPLCWLQPWWRELPWSCFKETHPKSSCTCFGSLIVSTHTAAIFISIK